MTSFWRSWIPAVATVIASGGLLFLGSWWLATTTPASVVGTILGTGGAVALIVNALLGAWLDRCPRHHVLALAQGVLVVCAVGYAFVLTGPSTTASVVAVAFLQVTVMTAETLYFAAVELLSLDLAPPTWPRRRLSLLGQIPSQLDRIVSPVFAGALVGTGHPSFVPPATVAVVVASHLATRTARAHRLSTSCTRAPGQAHQADQAEPAPLADISAWRLVRENRALAYLLVFGALSNLAVFPLLALLPAYYSQVLQPGPHTAVWTSRAIAAYAVGMAAATLLIAQRPTEPEPGTALRHATTAHLAICTVLATATTQRHPVALVVALAGTGFLFALLVAAGGQIWLHHTPAASTGRVLSLKRLTAFSTIPLGTALLGALGQTTTLATATSRLCLTSAALTILAWAIIRPATPSPRPLET